MIRLVDEQNNSLITLDVDFEDVLNKISGVGRDFYSKAASVLKQSILDTYSEYEIVKGSDTVIEAYLRQFAASGNSDGELAIKVRKLHGGGRAPVIKHSDVFDAVVQLPNTGYELRYNRLVGLDDVKEQIRKEASLMLDPTSLQKWSVHHHKRAIDALQVFKDRYSFFVFEGDVGTGKTEFAETFGDAVARQIGQPVSLARISMKSRGDGIVGEMSKRISQVFQEAVEIAKQTKSPVILLLDEADSLAQSREGNQMHHEDRAGVNALIQGIDKIRHAEYPVMVVFCTNRFGALDPALKRRAAFIRRFERPNDEQRKAILTKYLGDLQFSARELDELITLTGPTEDRRYGFTYSDLVTRLIPQAILDAYPSHSLTYNVVHQVAMKVHPTPPFNGE